MNIGVAGDYVLVKKPIEVTFPVAKVNAIAEKESTGFGRRHYRPWSVMHKWWARRLGSVFRTILLYTLADKGLCEWSQNPEDLWELYSQDVDLSEKIVLDPMMGGGTTIVEGLRLGCKMIGWDLNPVAWFVVKKQVEDIDPQLLRDTLVELEQELGLELRKYYRTICPECGSDAEGIYYFYCKELDCPDCGEEIPLIHDFFLARSLTGFGDIVVCPDCWDVFETQSSTKQTTCGKCGGEFVPSTKRTGGRRKYICNASDCSPIKIVEWIAENGRPRERMYAVEFYCKKCDEAGNPKLKKGRGYKSTDPFDYQLLQEARQEFVEVEQNLPIPSTAIPEGVETRRALNHGYIKFRDLFNERQLLNLGKIHRWIMDFEDWQIKEFFLLAFSNCLKYNNMFAKYNSTRGFITDIFRTHSYSPSMAPVEANCYDTPKGRGAFTAFVQLVIEGKEYCRAPFERIVEEGKQKKISHSTQIVGNVVLDYESIQENGNTMLQCGSSERMDIPDGVVDAVVTDPPYADNVMYSELSNFFYVWLRISLRERYDIFKHEFVPWKDEIIVNRVQEKGQHEFLDGLRRVLEESNRTLKDDGLLVFTFHHRDPKAWGSVLQAVMDSDFFVTAVYPIRSEMKTSTHLHGVENITIDLIFVCRKRKTSPPTMEWEKIREMMVQSSRKMIEKCREDGKEIGEKDVFVMILGRCLEIYSQYYPNIIENGRRVGVQEAVDTISEIVAER